MKWHAKRNRIDYWLAARLQPATWAVWLYRLAHWSYCSGIPILPVIIDTVARVVTGIEIHHRATIGRNFMLYHGSGTVIGDSAVIGDNCSIFHGVTLGVKGLQGWEPGNRNHPRLGNGVTVYAGAKLVGPITIGDYATIGANAVLLCDMPKGSTAIGIPARIVPPRETSQLPGRSM